MLEDTANTQSGPAAVNDRFIAEAAKDGDFWGDNGALAWEKTRLYETETQYEKDRRNKTGDMIETLSKASKTYCLAALYAADQLNLCRPKELKKKLRWLTRKYWCLIVARWLAHKVGVLSGSDKNMTADQLGIRADVLYLWRRYYSAGDCLEVALLRNGLPPDTRVELLAQMAKVTWRQNGKIPEQIFVDVERIILDNEVSPRVIVRFLRTKAKILEKAGAPSHLTNQTAIRAAQIATQHNLPKEVGDWGHRARV